MIIENMEQFGKTGGEGAKFEIRHSSGAWEKMAAGMRVCDLMDCIASGSVRTSPTTIFEVFWSTYPAHR